MTAYDQFVGRHAANVQALRAYVPELSSRTYWTVGLSFVVAYVAIERATYAYQLDGLGITLWGPTAGLSLVLLMGGGLSYAPFVFTAALVTTFAVYAGPRGWIAPAATSLVLALGLAALAAGLRKGADLAHPRLTRVATALAIVPAATLVIALVYCAMLYALDQLYSWTFLLALRNFWIGDTLGIITVLPAVPAVSRLLSRGWHWAGPSAIFDAGAFAAALIAALWVIFALERAHEYQFFYLLFLPVVWIAVRQGYPGVAIALLVTHISLVTIATALGYAAYDFIAFQMVMLVLSATGLLLGAAVTESRCSEARLRAQQSELARAARHALVGATGTALAHEISQPLASATNYLHAATRILHSSNNADPAVAMALSKAQAEAQRARETLERVRDYVASGRVAVTTVDLKDLLAKLLTLISRGVDARRVNVTMTSAPHLPSIRGDAIQLEQLFLNLLTNALDAAAESQEQSGRVDIDVQRHRERVVVTIEDNGPGITEDMADRMFEPFETTKQTGMGLGLTLARQIVEAHAGELRAENRVPHGARFTVELYIDGLRT